ncbi:MAG: CoA pyrophosphatase [Bacteroidia bacterium]|nr:CoA pyrophosphatase [Bacteroidia bacterium]
MQHRPQLFEQLAERLRQPLPGLDAQMTMSPPLRGREVQVPPNARQSAVLVLLYPREGRLCLPLMERGADGQVHSGQISLPGGRRDPEDPDFAWTALRETHEEFGIPPEQVRLLGSLTELYIPPSNYLVYPQLGCLEAPPQIIPHPREVASVIEVELAHLLDDSIRSIRQVRASGSGFMVETPVYTLYQQHCVWGATAMILAELLTILRELNA